MIKYLLLLTQRQKYVKMVYGSGSIFTVAGVVFITGLKRTLIAGKSSGSSGLFFLFFRH
jgi:uncharacterized membrane protein YecN with MAPEG domain